MEADYLLAHNVDIGRPEGLIVIILIIIVAQSGDIVAQSVDPHIDDMAGVKVHGNAPCEGGTGNAEILKTGLDEVIDHLVYTAAGLKEIGVFQKILNAVGVLGETEEVCFLLGVLNLTAAVGALAVHKLALGPEALAGLAVFAGVLALIYIAVFIHLLEDLLNGGNVIVIGGADEAVVGDVHQLPEVLYASLAQNDIVNELLGSHAGLGGLVLYLLAVLIGTGEEHDLMAGEALIAGNGVGCHGAVSMAYMELIAGIINRRCDIKFLVFHLFSPSKFILQGNYS